MNVQEIMSANPACCSPDSTLEDTAQMMCDCDCGEIPVLDSAGKPIGVITDRDIACRAVAQGKGPGTLVREVMSSPAVTVSQDTSVEDCCSVMESNKIRRVPVVDEQGCCCGIVAQADLAQKGSEKDTAELVRKVSEPAMA